MSENVRYCRQNAKYACKCHIFTITNDGEYIMNMNINLKILELMNTIMPQDISCGYWQLEFLLEFIMENPESINNLNRNVYPYVAEKFNCKPWCIEKNISRLIPLIDLEKLSEITGIDIKIETLTVSRLIRIMIIYLRLSIYHCSLQDVL